MKHDPLYLATLIGSRICYDLLSLIGKKKDGLELLQLCSQKSSGSQIYLIEESTDFAIGRVKIFSIAFGMGSAQAELYPYGARNMLLPLFNGSRVFLSWPIEMKITQIEAQAIFVSILIFEMSMPLGGDINIGMKRTKPL